MSYLVLARKYRPQAFDEVIGQSHVTRTLKNAVTSGRVAHALLFSGPRGTGKTTVARILAKTLNCSEREKTGASEPCNTCRSCMEITAGSAADVFEIDGASNNSVDQIRDLRENVKYRPVHSPYKIYIIDEVHMLSLAAFNALLKTLEEPPAHVLFLFATTEAHKIPITIMSRCQRHDMRRVQMEEMTRHMKSLCEKEGVEIPDQSVELLAQESGGSVRDGLSLLDQVISSAEGSVDHERVLSILGVVDRKIIFDISAAVLKRDMVTLLETIDQVYDRGHDMKKLYAKLIQHFRNLMVLSMGQGSDRLVDLPEHDTKTIRQQLHNVSPHFITGIMERLFAEESVIRFSSQPKLALEMAFVKILQAEPALPIDTLIDKLDRLQKTVADTDYPRPVQAGTGTPASPDDVREPRAPYGGPPAGQGAFQPPVQPAQTQPATQMQVQPAQAQPATQMQPQPAQAQPPTQMQPQPAQAQPATHVQPQQPPTPMQAEPVQAHPAPVEGTTAEPTAIDPAIAFRPTDPPDVSWQRFITFFKGVSPSLGMIASKSTLKNLTEKSIEIELTGRKFDIKRIEIPKNMDIFKRACRSFFGNGLEITVHTVPEAGPSSDDKRKRIELLRNEAKENPVIKEAEKVFDGKILEITILEEKAHERHGKHDEAGPEASVENDETSGGTGR